MFLLCLLFLAVSVVVVPFALAAHRNEGTFGTFTARDRTCSDRFVGCHWTGTFESDDGRTRDDLATFRSDELTRPGDQARAQRGVEGDKGLYKPDDGSWLLFVLGDVGCLAYVIHWIRRWRRQRGTSGTAVG